MFKSRRKGERPRVKVYRLNSIAHIQALYKEEGKKKEQFQL